MRSALLIQCPSFPLSVTFDPIRCNSAAMLLENEEGATFGLTSTDEPHSYEVIIIIVITNSRGKSSDCNRAPRRGVIVYASYSLGRTNAGSDPRVGVHVCIWRVYR